MLSRRNKDLDNGRVQTQEVCSTSTAHRIKFKNGPTSDQNISMMKKENPKKKATTTIDPRIGLFDLSKELSTLKMKVEKVPYSSNSRKFYQKYDIPATRSFPSTLLQLLQSINGNDVCVDCMLKSDKKISENRPLTWANISFGTLICNECAFGYFSEGIECSVLSTNLSFWTLPDILVMFEGGNGRLIQELDDNKKLNFLKRKSSHKAAKGYEMSLAKRVAELCSAYSECDVAMDAILEHRKNRGTNNGSLESQLPTVEEKLSDAEDKPKPCQRRDRRRSLSSNALIDLMKNVDHQDKPSNWRYKSDKYLTKNDNQTSSTNSIIKNSSGENTSKKKHPRRNSAYKYHMVSEDDGSEEVKRNIAVANVEARRYDHTNSNKEDQMSSRHLNHNRQVSPEQERQRSSRHLDLNRQVAGEKARDDEHHSLRKERQRSSRHLEKSRSRRNEFTTHHSCGKEPEETGTHHDALGRKNKESSHTPYLRSDDDTAVAVLYQSVTKPMDRRKEQ